MTPSPSIRKRVAGVRALHAYFRGAEYPPGRVVALWRAVALVRSGWPRHS